MFRLGNEEYVALRRIPLAPSRQLRLWEGMSEELARNMRGRIDQCRRLAKTTTDERAAQILRQMADEVEADLNRLLAEMAAEPVVPIEIPPPAQS